MRTKNAAWAALILVAPVLMASVGCKSSPANAEVTDTRTNWLEACDSDAECGTALACLCGSCTIACTTDTQCTDLDDETTCRAVESCAAASAVCTRSASNAGGSSAQGGGGSGGTQSSATPSGGEENGSGGAANPGGGDTGSGGATSPSANGGAGGDTQSPAGLAGASSGNAGASTGGTGSSMTLNAGTSSGGMPSGGLALGETCHSTSETVTDTCASGSFCDPIQICTDAIPPSCWSSCTCNGPGQQCRTELDGEVLLDRPCCTGYACVAGVETPDSGQQAYFCREDADAECTADCDVTANSPSCEDRPGFPHLWMCRTPPDEVLAGCVDLATNLPRWCCPETVLPQCVP